MNYVFWTNQAVTYSIERAPKITGSDYNQTAVALIIAAMFAAVIACRNGWLSRIEWRWLTWVGALTYPVYLVHGQLGFFVAWLIHVLVEKPFQGPMRRAIRLPMTDEVDLHEPPRTRHR